MIADFRNKLTFEPKKVVFIEKEYTVKTDHKTGLLLTAMLKTSKADNDAVIKLLLGEKQAKELFEELDAQENSNYLENSNTIVFVLFSIVYNRPVEDFENAYKANTKN